MATDPHILDNPCWHGLNTNHAHLASGTDRVKSYAPIFDLYALVDHDVATYQELKQIAPDDRPFAIWEAQPPQEIPGLRRDRGFAFEQWISTERLPEPEPAVEVSDLKADDIPEILALVELAQPGPISPRSLELGPFLGIRQKGQLVALAGQRLQPTGYVEITAICTHPDWRGKGYARLLTQMHMHRIYQRGDTPFLHVAHENVAAKRLYESLGFRHRSDMAVAFFTR